MTAAGGRRVVVIGVGNEFRRDDGIGPEVLSRLREHMGAEPGAGVETMVQLVYSDGESASMIEAWTGAILAVVVDADMARPACLGPVELPRQVRADGLVNGLQPECHRVMGLGGPRGDPVPGGQRIQGHPTSPPPGGAYRSSSRIRVACSRRTAAASIRSASW